MLAIGRRLIADPFYHGVHAPLPRQTVTRLGTGSSFEAAMIRLLLGTADLHDLSGTLLLKQRTNFTVIGGARSGVRTEGGVRQSLRRAGLSAKDVDKHLRRGLTHQAVYKSIVSELIEYFVREADGECTLAFLHAYRLLERIAFVFPLLYAARSSKHAEAFTTLKAYFKGGVESELGLIRKFQDGSIDLAYRDAPTDLDFSRLDSTVGPSAMAAAKRCISDGDLISYAFPIMTIKSGGLLNLLINVRNRYFHSSISNEANIAVTEMGDSDEFFAVINFAVINWLAVLIVTSLADRIR